MKKEKFLIAGLLIVLVLAFGMVLASCDDGTPPDDYYKREYKGDKDVSGSGDKIVTNDPDIKKPVDHGKIPGIPGGADGSNPFVGTWSNGDITVIITDTTWSAVVEGSSFGGGTYSHSGNTATFADPIGSFGGTATAIISGNTMTISSSGVTVATLTKDEDGDKEGGAEDNPGY